MTKTEESRLQALEDREAIRELQATYCFLVDDGRPANSWIAALRRTPAAISVCRRAGWIPC